MSTMKEKLKAVTAAHLAETLQYRVLDQPLT